MDFLRQLGRVALGSRLRRLTDHLINDAARAYAAAGVDFAPRWFPLFRLIAEQGPVNIVEAARRLGLTHPAVSQFRKELAAAKLVKTQADAADERKRAMRLTPRGQALYRKLQPFWATIEAAVDELLEEAGVDLFDTIDRLEAALARTSMTERIQRHGARRRGADLEIIGYEPRYRAFFKTLNLAWIKQYFAVEPDDERILSDPEGTILAKGGFVFFARQDQQIVGTCALKKNGRKKYELAKMAVAPAARGRGIGEKLLAAVIDKARSAGADEVALETNRKLTAAVALYRKHGFLEAPLASDVKFKRTDLAMRLNLAALTTASR